MKRVLFVSILLASLSVAAFAQRSEKPQKPDGQEWFQRMRSEKIAFLTAEMNLTPEEAQVFWPVYNKAQEEEMAANKASRDAFMSLEKGTSSKLGEKEIEKLVAAYIDADAARVAVAKKYLPEFQKVLPAVKVAKLYLAEERFRMSRITRLRECRPGAPAGNGPQQSRPDNQGGPSMEMQFID